ncbi:MAG: hypothetical protein H0X23_09920 [Rubrobacter sp.]|nr:hypothetical protein [Rubrobacter sp.]
MDQDERLGAFIAQGKSIFCREGAACAGRGATLVLADAGLQGQYLDALPVADHVDA